MINCRRTVEVISNLQVGWKYVVSCFACANFMAETETASDIGFTTYDNEPPVQRTLRK
jgi:hypothetical protein